MKQYFSIFQKRSPRFYLIIILVGILNSAMNSAFMIVVSKSISNPGSFIFQGNYLSLCLGLLVACIGINLLFYSYMISLSANIVNEVEMGIIQKIRSASFHNLSRIGNEEVYAALRNIGILGDAPGKLINILIAFLSVTGCIIYLFCISYVYGLIISGLIIVTIYSFFIRTKIFDKDFNALRQLQIDYYKQLGDLLLGFKDIKMSSLKNENIYSRFIFRNRQSAKQLDACFKFRVTKYGLITNYTWYFALGLALFIAPKLGQSNLHNSSIFAVILLYIIGPVTTITGLFSFLAELKFATGSLDSINSKLSKEGDIKSGFPGKAELHEFFSLQFQDIYFEHVNEVHGKIFSLGPVNIGFREGELVFLIGGNGSGKSTFLNILTGLLKPLKGNIYYNGELVTDDLYGAYRDKIAAVFSDGYLLRNNYEDFKVDGQNESFVKYMKLMKLDGIASWDDVFELKSSLSKGQQKRLLLILTLMMDKKILVWDEWEAEQDPAFKDYFFEYVIPFLRNEGRTIIAITHDDRYLSLADRIIKFRDGKAVCVESFEAGSAGPSPLP